MRGGKEERMLSVGVDVHKRESQLTVVDERGAVLGRHRVATRREAVHEALGAYAGPMKAVVEACSLWGPMHDWLGEVADEVLVAHPAKVRAIADARIKTDAIDSETLAHLLRADLIPEAYAPSPEVRGVKRVLRQRVFFVETRTRAKNRVQWLLTQHQVERPEVTDLFGVAGMKWLKGLELPSPDREVLREDLKLVEYLAKRIRATERLLARLSRGDEGVRLLRSVPGIGQFLSVLIRYEVDDIGRFRSAKKFASYTGLVPSTYSSGDHTRHGRLTKRGNRWLRWAFVEAVWPGIRCSSWLRRCYERIKSRRGVNAARVATGRKLAEVVWKIWTERRCYDERH
jgi:transposase